MSENEKQSEIVKYEPPVTQQPGRIIVVAKDAEQMNLAQQRLVSWAAQKVEAEKSELALINTNLETAKKRKWATDALRRLKNKQEKRITYYEKIEAALKAGYTIVPNFPSGGFEIFAVRTERSEPKERSNSTRYGTPFISQERSESPKIGEGKYVSPDVTVESWSDELKDKEGKPYTMNYASAESFREVEFPFHLAKTEILEDTAKAMELGIFDDLIALPPRRQKADPMIVGRIHLGGKGSAEFGDGKTVSFLVTWFVDTEVL